MKTEIQEDQVELQNGETINYRYAGRGPLVVLLHGNMSSAVFWDHTIDALADRYTVLAPDLRGYGKSSYKKKIQSIGDFSEDLLLFFEALSLKKIHLTGWSLGGAVALDLVLKRQDLFESLCLLACAGLGDEKKKGVWRLPGFEEVMGVDWPLTTDAKTPFLGYAVQMLWETTMYNVRQPSKEDYDRYLEGSLAQRNRREVIGALQDFSMPEEDWEKIVLPTLRIQGREDRVLGLPRTIHRTKNCKLYILEDCGHFIMNDQFDKYIALYRDFLRKETGRDKSTGNKGNK